MPPLQKEDKSRQVHTDDLFLPSMGIVLPEKLDEIENSMFFHGGMVKKIDTLLREHEKKIILEELVSVKHPPLFSEESFIELRTPLNKRVESSMFQLEKKPGVSFYKKLTMPDEFKTEFLTIHNPSFRFVSDLHFAEDVLLIKNPEDRHVEIIDLSSLVTDTGDVQKESILLLNKNPTKEKHTENASESKKDTNTFQSKKVEVAEIKKLDDKKCENTSAATTHRSKGDPGKAKIYYLTSKNLDEKKIKELEKKQSYIPVDFEDKMQKLKEKEQRELEKQKDAEQKRKQKEQRDREKEEKRLQMLEEKLEAKRRKKKEKKVLFEKRKKEAEEEKLLKKEAAYAKEKKLESAVSKKEEKRLKKLEEKQAIREAKQKNKEEKEAMIKILEREAEERKQLKKKTRRGENDELKESVLLKSVEAKQTPTFVDDDVIKVLLMTDDLLGNLPEDVIDKFAKSEDFKLYEKVISKYKAK